MQEMRPQEEMMMADFPSGHSISGEKRHKVTRYGVPSSIPFIKKCVVAGLVDLTKNLTFEFLQGAKHYSIATC